MSGHTQRSDMDHTVLPANYTMPAFCFASVHQIAPPLSEVAASDGSLVLIYRPKGMKG